MKQELPKYQELLDAGVHFGHMKKKWNPRMLPYIFMERKGIHIIDLNRTLEAMDKAGKAAYQLAKNGKKILYVATKKQARNMVKAHAESVNMPYVTERWLGGMLTNFSTIRKSVKKMNSIDKMLADGSLSSVTKRERLTLTRERNNLEKVIGGISVLNRLPAMVDTNSDPTTVDFAIPSNDDASKSIDLVTSYITACIKEGLADRQKDRDQRDAAKKKETAS